MKGIMFENASALEITAEPYNSFNYIKYDTEHTDAVQDSTITYCSVSKLVILEYSKVYSRVV